MRSRTFVLALAAVLALALLIVGSLRPSPPESAEREHALAAPPNAPSTTEIVAPSDDAPEEARVVEAGAPAAAPAPQNADECEIRGRILLPGKVPARGASVRVDGWPGNAERVALHGAPRDWPDPECVTGADGRFTLRFVPPRAFQFTVDVRAARHARARWRWSSLEPGAVKDLGDVVLQLGGTITGRVVDARGKPLAGAWNVGARPEQDAKFDDSERQQPTRFAIVDANAGTFTLEEVAPGNTSVSATSELGTIDGRPVTVVAGQNVEVDLVYDGPDLARRIVVYVSMERRGALVRDLAGIDMHGPSGDRKLTAKRGSSSFVADDLAPGSYSFAIDDPRFEPWGQAGVAPGTRLRAVVRGSSGVALRVVDRATKAPIEAYTLTARYTFANRSPETFPLVDAGDTPPPDGVFHGLVPGELELVVRVPGRVDAIARVPALAPREVRAVTLELGNGATITGRVLRDGTRAPVAGVEVTLGPPSNPAPNALISNDDAQLPRATTGADGSFTFTGLPNRVYEARAEHGVFVVSAPLLVARDTADDGDAIELVLPAWGKLHGRLRVPAAGAAEGMRIGFGAHSTSREEQLRITRATMRNASARTWPIAADGSYATGPLPAGEHVAVVQMPQFVTRMSGGSMTTGGGELALGDVTIVAGEDREHDFTPSFAFPGNLVVHVRDAHGAPAAGWNVVALTEGETPHQAGGVTDEHGDLRGVPVLPGDYWIDVSPQTGKWLQVEPRAVRVETGRATEVEIVVRTSRGVVTLRDENGPLALVDVSVTSLTPTWRSLGEAFKTNERGEIELERPVGKLRFERRGSMESALARGGRTTEQASGECEWTAAGPVPETVTLETPK